MREALIQFIIQNYPRFNETLQREIIKADHYRKIENFPWYLIIQSMATFGRAAAANNFDEYYPAFNYTLLKNNFSTENREEYLLQHLRQNRIRYPKNKAQYINRNIELIENEGGIEKFNSKIENLPDYKSKMDYLLKLNGFGPKYARNFWMDLYDNDFRNSIAIDSRIENILNILDSNKGKYEEKEKYLLDFTSEVGNRLGRVFNAWMLDRILFNHYKEITGFLNNN